MSLRKRIEAEAFDTAECWIDQVLAGNLRHRVELIQGLLKSAKAGDVPTGKDFVETNLRLGIQMDQEQVDLYERAFRAYLEVYLSDLLEED